MARKTKRSPLFLKDDQLQNLNKISRTRISPAQEIQRAKILLSYYENPNISKVAKNFNQLFISYMDGFNKTFNIPLGHIIKKLSIVGFKS